MSQNLFSQLLDNELELFIKNTKLFPSDVDGNLKGVHAEATFRNIIKRFVPSELEVSNGWIYDENGSKSDERDILVYDPKKAPRFLFEAGVGIIPLSSVHYDIQVKSSSSKKRIKESYDKFNDKSPCNVLISINGKNLLEDYLDIDKDALNNPKIKILSSEEDTYYFFSSREIKYSDVFTMDIILQEFAKQGIKIKSDNIFLNGLDLNTLKEHHFTVYQWQSFSLPHKVKGFIIGMLNTLYQNNAGNYIIDQDQKVVAKVLTRLLVDNNGKVLKKEINLQKGLPSENFQFSFQAKNGKATVTLKDET